MFIDLRVRGSTGGREEGRGRGEKEGGGEREGYRRGEKGRAWERQTERHSSERETCLPYASNQGLNPQLGVCPEWGWNLQPFGTVDDTSTNWGTQPGALTNFFKGIWYSSLTEWRELVTKNWCYKF